MILSNFIQTSLYLFLILYSFSFSSCDDVEKNSVAWSFPVSDRIQSNLIVDQNVIYFGCNDSSFYAIDANSGKELWKKKTGYKIRSQATISDSIIFFSSGNNLYAVNKSSGRKIWTFHSSDSTGSRVIDPWDYHTGSPVIYNSAVYVGFGNGLLLGFDLKTGEEIFRFLSQDSSAIRSTPIISNGAIYFGDWNGIIYAVDLRSTDTLWTYHTYEVQPYPTFGQINTKLYMHDTLLLFGARNPEIQALNIYSGKKIWSYIEEDGGWISGDPIVSGDTLFIGGSDNHKLIAFDVYTGEILWQYEFLFNNFSQPVTDGSQLLFTTGDAYAFMGNNLGNGYLYLLNRKNGSLINMAYFEGNIFNSPVLHNGEIFIAGDDMMLHAIDRDTFINTTKTFKENGQGPVGKMEVTVDTSVNSILFSFEMKFQAFLTINVRSFEGELINTLFEKDQNEGKHSLTWDGRNTEGNFVEDGYYIIETKSDIFIKYKITPFENQK